MKDQIVIDSAKGKYLFSNKKRYLDFSLSNGTMIFGHSEKSLIKKSISQIKKGTSYSNLNYYELKFKSLLSILFNEFNLFDTFFDLINLLLKDSTNELLFILLFLKLFVN